MMQHRLQLPPCYCQILLLLVPLVLDTAAAAAKQKRERLVHALPCPGAICPAQPCPGTCPALPCPAPPCPARVHQPPATHSSLIGEPAHPGSGV